MASMLVLGVGCTPGSITSTAPSTAVKPTNPPNPAASTNTLVPLTPTNPPIPTAKAVTPTPGGIQSLPNTGQQISPLAVPGSKFENLNPNLADNPDWLAGQAVTTVVSPDKKTLLVLTSGYNRVFRTAGPPDPFGTYFNWPDSKEYVFIYDISTGSAVKKQVVTVPSSYFGIAFDPSGKAFYVSSGVGDAPFDSSGAFDPAKSGGDNVHIFTLDASGKWQNVSELALGHVGGLGLAVNPPNGEMLPPNQRVAVSPCAAGVAVSNDGKTLVAVNYYNDSISVFHGGLGSWDKGTELDLRPGKNDPAKAGVPGGEYPFWAEVKGSGSSTTAYISSMRDREIVVVNLGGKPLITTRIPVKGQPNKMTLNADQSLLYVVEDQSDAVDVIDTLKNSILETIPVLPHPDLPAELANYTGVNANSVTLSPDETQLYVTMGNLNAIAVIALDGKNSSDRAVALIPTGWYPTSVSFSGDGKMVFVTNAKSPTGSNADFYYSYGPPTHKNGYGANEYNPQLIKAGLQTFPLPDAAELKTLTAQVAENNRFSYKDSANDEAVMAAVRQGVKHVIFIIKENRTYDQILGDLGKGNGDPSLAEFGKALTPNQHNLAQTFVTLDNFYDSAEVSNDGWPWTTSGRPTVAIENQFPVYYAGRGLSLDSEGLNRNVNVSIPTASQRQNADPMTPADPDLLAGQANMAAPDGPDNQVNTGYFWDSALRANLSVRNYGFFIDGSRYQLPHTSAYFLTLAHDPASTGTQTAFSTNVSLAPYTDPYFRGWDPTYPDFWRYKEWEREFDSQYASGKVDLPALSLVRFMNDHTGDFATAIDGVNTPELQQADNDYAVGMLVEKISKSKYANNTLIFIIEDDSQDGPDHVDSHRSIAFVAGAYVKQGAVISSSYNTVNFLRTMEEVLGLPPLNLNDALARPMTDIFNTTPSAWSFTAVPAPSLYNTQLPLPPKPVSLVVPKTTHDAAYWAMVTKGMDFTAEDRMGFAAYNHILWVGLMGNKPYPAVQNGQGPSQDEDGE